MTFEKLPAITCDTEDCNSYHILTREEFHDVNGKTDWLERRRTNDRGKPVGSHYCPDCQAKGKVPERGIHNAERS